MYYAFNILFEIVIFQNVFLQYFNLFRYVDEVIMIVLLSLLSISFIRKKFTFSISENDKKVILFFFIYLGIGIISSIVYKIQPQKIAVLKDILATSKMIICYISILLLTDMVDKDMLSESVYKRSKIYIVILFIGAIINLIFETSMTASMRYGLRSYKFLFTHETYLVSSLVLLIAVIEANRKPKDDDKFILMALIGIILSFRTKGFLFVIAYSLIKLLNKYNIKIKIWHIAVILGLGIIIFSGKIIDTYSDGLTAARPALHIIGIYLLIRYFPLGSGFGTFASAISGEYYSPLYSMYNIDNVFGITKTNYNYISDTFWPYVYGQAGIFGLISYVLMLVYMFKGTEEKAIKSNKSFIPAFLIIVYLFISSTSEAIFIDVTGAMSIIILCGYLRI